MELEIIMLSTISQNEKMSITSFLSCGEHRHKKDNGECLRGLRGRQREERRREAHYMTY
jgi:hypothetical protein